VRKKPNIDLAHLTTLTVAGFLLYSPISILAYPVSVLVVNPESSILLLFIVGLLITFASFLLYLALLKLAKSEFIKKSTPNYVYFVSGIILVGAFRGVIFYYFNEALDLQQPSSFFKRVLASAFTTVFWLCAANVIINLSRSFKRRYQSTLNQFLASRISAPSNGQSSSDSNADIRSLEDDLSKSLSGLLGKSDSQTFNRVSGELTLLINERLRPLSRRIWLRSLNEYPVVNYKGLFKDSLRMLTFSRTIFLLIMTLLALLNNLFLRSISESFWRTLTYLLATVLCILLYDISVKKWHSIYLNSVFIFSIGFIPILLSEMTAGFLSFENNYFAAMLIIPIPPVVLIVLSLFDLTQKDQASLLTLLEEHGDSIFSDLAPGVDLNQRQIASYLHNSFQSELLALSKQLAAAALSKDKDAASSVLQRASSVANRSLSENLVRMNDQPLDHLTQLIKSWENILSIKIVIPQDVLHEKLNSVVFVQTVEEIASNAFRHDRATELTIKCSEGLVGTKLFFQSNGSQPISKSQGMGDTWLNQISLTAWTIEKNALGTLIVLEL
jgi:hypothetical protein